MVMFASMGGAASKSEMKPNTHMDFFNWDETLQCVNVQFCLWRGQVPASSTLVLILETATRDLIRYLSGRDVSTASDLLLFPQAETFTHELFQFSFYTKSTWSAQTSFITGLNAKAEGSCVPFCSNFWQKSSNRQLGYWGDLSEVF